MLSRRLLNTGDRNEARRKRNLCSAQKASSGVFAGGLFRIVRFLNNECILMVRMAGDVVEYFIVLGQSGE